MTKKEELLKKREKIKAKRPDFDRQESEKFARISKSWRRPRGRHSKMREGLKGNAATVNVGYRSPKKVRGLLKDGTEPVRVFSVNDLDEMDPEEQSAIIGSSVGKRKRVEIVKKAKEKDIKIHNLNDLESYEKRVKKEVEERQKKRKKRLSKKEQKKAEKEEEEKKKEKSDKTQEDLKEEKEKEKKEAEKVITAKQ